MKSINEREIQHCINNSKIQHVKCLSNMFNYNRNLIANDSMSACTPAATPTHTFCANQKSNIANKILYRETFSHNEIKLSTSITHVSCITTLAGCRFLFISFYCETKARFWIIMTNNCCVTMLVLTMKIRRWIIILLISSVRRKMKEKE
jgi:hypothetical protein